MSHSGTGEISLPWTVRRPSMMSAEMLPEAHSSDRRAEKLKVGGRPLAATSRSAGKVAPPAYLKATKLTEVSVLELLGETIKGLDSFGLSRKAIRSGGEASSKAATNLRFTGLKISGHP